MAIPLFRPYVGQEECDAVAAVFKSRSLTRGEQVAAFEAEFAEFVGKKFAVATNSGTSGLHLSVRALGWHDGDEVVTTAFSFVASSNALVFERAIPVFVDIDPVSLNLDPSLIGKKITSRTRGILPVHAFGLPADMKAIRRVADCHGLTVLEDACEAIGSPSDAFPVASYGDISVYGFHQNKQLTTAGEGGMIVTDDASLAAACRSMRDQGRSAESDWVRHVALGYNYRLTEAQAAFGRVQLGRADLMLRRREEIAARYTAGLAGVGRVVIPCDAGFSRSWFVYPLRFGSTEERTAVATCLRENGVACSDTYFPPIYQFPIHRAFQRSPLVETERASATLLALPLYYELRDGEVDEICGLIRRILE